MSNNENESNKDDNNETDLNSDKEKHQETKKAAQDSRFEDDEEDDEENNRKNKTIYEFKIILLGNVAVGKTCIISRFAENAFSKHYKCSVGIEFKVKSLPVDQSSIADLTIWDTCGDEKYKGVTKQYYRDANGILLVFDLTQRDTFQRLDEWMNDIKDTAPEDVIVILVGNKNDLVDLRTVQTNEASAYAKKINIEYLEVSAKTGNNILLLFEKMSSLLVQKFKNADEAKQKEKSERKKTKKLSNIAIKGKNDEKKKCC